MEFLNLGGAIASILAACFAFWQAYRAKSFRDQIQEHRIKLLLTELVSAGQKARVVSQRISTRIARLEPLIGRQANLDVIRTFVEMTGDHIHLFKTATIQQCVRSITGNLREYAAETKESHRQQIGDAISKSVGELIAAFNRLLDQYH